jgi:hypothetical protein
MASVATVLLIYRGVWCAQKGFNIYDLPVTGVVRNNIEFLALFRGKVIGLSRLLSFRLASSLRLLLLYMCTLLRPHPGHYS